MNQAVTKEVVMESHLTTPDREINYSIALLERDRNDRAHILEELARVKKDYQIQNCTILEAGCGFGDNLQVFRSNNTVIGIEGLPEAVAQAGMRGLDVREGDLNREICLRTAAADWILCLDVLEHLENPLKLMNEIWRVLRRDGRAIINVPNHFNLAGRIKLLFGHDLDVHRFFPQCHEWDNPHLRFFTYRGINRLLRVSGFRVLEDRSSRFCSLPKQSIFNKLQLQSISRSLARLRPSLFAGGFFLIVEKRPLELTSAQ
jgi:SAM-dependent methyltransferase